MSTDMMKKFYNLFDGFGQMQLQKGYQAEGHDDSHGDFGGHISERIVAKWFGPEGLLAQKTLARSRQTFRTTVAALAVAVVAGLLVMLWKHNGKRLFSLAASLICAGALGNLIDRAVHGYVIDFIDLYWRGWHWPAFNVADIAICAGCAFFIWDELRSVSRSR